MRAAYERAMGRKLVQNPENKRMVRVLADRALLRIAKERRSGREKEIEKKGGPQGEQRTLEMAGVVPIDLSLIEDDSDFKNFRLRQSEEKMELLRESMKLEGLKVPVCVIETPAGTFRMRAGFRRLICARQLGWKAIPALILESDTPEVDEYWTNIIENSARDGLTTYEVANAARLMRNGFHVSTKEFAQKAGYSEGYVWKLLQCMDKLPDEVLDQWKNGARVSVETLYDFSCMDPHDALAAFRRFIGIRPERSLEERLRGPGRNDKLAKGRSLERMMRLYAALETNDTLELRTRQLCLKVIEFCMGAKDAIMGVYYPRAGKRRRDRAERKRMLKLPELPDLSDEIQGMPPPVDEED